MAGTTLTRICQCRFCDRDDLTPQGVRMHEQWCDENPLPGIDAATQDDLRRRGVLD